MVERVGGLIVDRYSQWQHIQASTRATVWVAALTRRAESHPGWALWSLSVGLTSARHMLSLHTDWQSPG